MAVKSNKCINFETVIFVQSGTLKLKEVKDDSDLTLPDTAMVCENASLRLINIEFESELRAKISLELRMRGEGFIKSFPNTVEVVKIGGSGLYSLR